VKMVNRNVCRHCWNTGKTGCSGWRAKTEIN